MSSRCTPTDDSAWRRAAAVLRRAAASRLLLFLSLLLLLPLGAAAQSIESVLAPGAVIQGHVKVETDCKSCHSRFDRAAQDGLCIACHKEVGADIRAHKGWHGKRQPQQQCRACHLEHRGRNAAMAAFDHKTFDHRLTEFELRDKHVGPDCAKCHLPGKRWRAAPETCVGCHVKDDVHKAGLGRRCEECHSAKGWKATAFDHDTKTHFALTGKHAQTKCDDCHANGRYKDTPKACIACHRKKDEHKGQFGEKCDSCHTTEAWRPNTFRHDLETTHYLLDGKHRGVRCTACHTGQLYVQKLGQACIDCHLKDDKHQGDLGRACADCHSPRGWKEAPGFDHASTRFPLRGAHEKVDCKDCHKDQQYRKTPETCIGCHRKDDRHQGNLGERCTECHDEVKWKPARGFDHQKTHFPLLNAHAAPKVRCADCHETLRAMRRTPIECISCHRRDDKHQGSLGEQCESCHRDSGWKVARFDHAKTRFPLLGAHLPLACKSCHLSQRYREAARDCIGCHRKDDKHKQAYGTNCASCHSVRAWPLWAFDHDRQTHERLEGKHRQAACAGCHTQPAPAGRNVAPTPQACAACHRKDDAHDGRFGSRCETCHAANDWNDVRPGAAGRAPAQGTN